MSASSLRIDPRSLAESLDSLARIGARPDGGVTRLAFSREDRQGRDWVVERMLELGMEIRIDPIGNLFGILGGASSQPPVVLGSHTDTVGAGGRYDGALGVTAALEVIRTLKTSGMALARPVGVASFMNEEGVRFVPDMMGSLFARGALPLDGIMSQKGTDGVTLSDALRQSGMAGTGQLAPETWHAFLELHIEQGPELESRGEQIGVVTGVQGLRWLEVELYGAANHAGTTPMEGRADAGFVAAQAVARLREMTDQVDGLRATVGRMVQSPNLINVIAGHVQCTVDLRHPDLGQLDRADREARSSIHAMAKKEGVECTIRLVADASPVNFNAEVIGHVAAAAGSLGLSARRMISGAGHDAQILTASCPSAMIFVPSRNGVSHNPAEYSSPQACVDGANVLLQAAVALAV